MGNCFCCGKDVHKVIDFPNGSSQEKRIGEAKESNPSSDDPKRNQFYVLRSRGEQEESPDVVTDMLQVFSVDIYALLEPGDTIIYNSSSS